MEREGDNWRFRGFTNPNTTGVPDEYFDFVSPRLNGSEVKLMNYLMRRTYGFKKESDTVSISQMLNGIVKRDGTRLDEGSGLSKGSIITALNSLEKKGLIVRRRQFDFKGGFLATSYEVNRRPDTLGTKPDQGVGTLGTKVDQGGVVAKPDQGLVTNRTKPLVQNLTIQDTVNNRQLDNNDNVAKKTGRASALYELPDQGQPRAQTDLLAADILEALGDRQSKAFYQLVARKVPESVIRRTLSELKEGRAASSARVFTSTMLEFARGMRTAENAAAVTTGRADLVARFKRG